MTFARWTIANDAHDLHEHHHPQEEIWNVVEGSIALTVDGSEVIVGTRDAAVCPQTRHTRSVTTFPAPNSSSSTGTYRRHEHPTDPARESAVCA